MSNSINNFIWLDNIDYDQALKKQLECINELKSSKDKNKFAILGCEHPAVITLGYRADQETEVQDINCISAEKIKIIKTDRGGLATAHENGQLVIYPICKWSEMGFTAHGFVEFLFLVTKEFFQKLHVPLAEKNCITALHTANGKIAFFGLRLRKEASYHGLSINVVNDFKTFKSIKSCGTSSKEFDRISNYVVNPKLDELYKLWCSCFYNKLLAKKNQAAFSDAESLDS